MSVGQLNSTESGAATSSLLLGAPSRAYAALSTGQALPPWTFEPGPLTADEVELAVTHCRFCHGDLHLIDNDLGISSFPLVPGTRSYRHDHGDGRTCRRHRHWPTSRCGRTSLFEEEEGACAKS